MQFLSCIPEPSTEATKPPKLESGLGTGDGVWCFFVFTLVVFPATGFIHLWYLEKICSSKTKPVTRAKTVRK